MVGLSKAFQFRDVFSPRTVTALGERIHAVWPSFATADFIERIVPDLPTLGFMERNLRIRDALIATLPADYPHAVNILLQTLGPPLADVGETNWDSFIVMPLCAYVSACGQQHYELSMQALYEMTRRLSAENDLRTFLELDYERTMALLREWRHDPCAHVRRLVSEGTRPRLPLAGRIRRFQDDPQPLIDLLDGLKDDPSLYVRRSVANNLNDIAKDNPDDVVATLLQWQQGATSERQWLIRHAARTLLKQGNSGALRLLGYDPDAAIDVSALTLDKEQYVIGDTLTFNCTITAAATQAVMIDYVVHYTKTNGKTAAKVFKLKSLTLRAGEAHVLTRKHALKQTSIRRLYPGEHAIGLQVNGQTFPVTSFTLID